MKPKKPKHRVKIAHFLEGSKIQTHFVVDFRIDRKWVPLGEHPHGITKFKTQAEAEAAARQTLAALS